LKLHANARLSVEGRELQLSASIRDRVSFFPRPASAAIG
jgi:hypothetical protein